MVADRWNKETDLAFQDWYFNTYGQGTIPTYEDITSALRFGWNHALASEYPQETWEEVEEELERAWKESHQDEGLWADLKQHVREAWQRARNNWRGLAE